MQRDTEAAGADSKNGIETPEKDIMSIMKGATENMGTNLQEE